MLAETIACRLVGIRPESEKIKWYSVVLLEGFAKLDRVLHHTTYEGAFLPAEGPAFLVSNHRRMWDIARGYRVGQRSHRIPVTFAKSTLLDPTLKESAEVAARTGHKSDILNSDSIWTMRIRHGIAAICKGAGAESLTRGGGMKEINDFRKRGKAIITANRITACFVQETRDKEGKLSDPKPGAAWLAKDNPDIPIYFMGISKNRVSIEGPHTFNQLRNDPAYADLPTKYLIVAIVDKIANLLEPPERNDWYEVQRPQVLSRRTPK